MNRTHHAHSAGGAQTPASGIVSPPSDIEAERQLLGIVMQVPELVSATSLDATMFYGEANRHIASAMLGLAQHGLDWRTVEVIDELARLGKLEAVGGHDYVVSLSDTVPARSEAERLARRLRTLARRRIALSLVSRAQQSILDGDEAAAGETLQTLSGSLGLDPDRRPMAPADIVEAWREEGPLVRVPTGIPLLDDLCSGGLAIPWRVMCIGAPSAGKTALEVVIADAIARGGAFVGVLAVDEEPEDITIRLAQLAGFTIADAERRDPNTLGAMAAALRDLPLHLYDSRWTIEAAARDLASRAAAMGRPAALFLDSLHAVRSDAADAAGSPREWVEANAKAVRFVSENHRLLVFATVEANRASYRDDDAAENTNDLAAGAESRSIEFVAKTQLVLRTPKGHPNVVHVKVPKNRRASKGEFWLLLDRETHTLAPCENPRNDPGAAAAAEEAKLAVRRERLHADAHSLLRFVITNPDLGTKELRAQVATALGWGVDRFNSAKAHLERGVEGYRLVNRGSPHACKWAAERVEGAP